MFHCIFTIYNASAWCNHCFFRLDFSIDPILNFQETVRSNLRYDLSKKLSFLFLDDQICIYKIITQALCNNNTHGAFSNRWHTY